MGQTGQGAGATETAPLGTTGCDPDEGQWVGPHRPTDPGPRTAVVADSLVDDQDALWQGSRLAREGPIAIRSTGRTLYRDHRDWIRTLQPVPDRVIVALGTNAWDVPRLDGWRADDERSFRDLVGRIRARGISCIVVTTISPRPGARPSFHDHARRANAFLTSFVTRDRTGRPPAGRLGRGQPGPGRTTSPTRSTTPGPEPAPTTSPWPTRSAPVRREPPLAPVAPGPRHATHRA